MKLRRSLSVLAVFVMMNGTLLGSEPEGVLQVRWGELGKLIGGKKVALQLAKGARVKGRVRRVTEASIVLWVKRSPDYPKGQSEIAREAVSRIEIRSSKKAKPARQARRIGLAVGAFAASLVGSTLILFASQRFDGSVPGGIYALQFGVATGVAVLTYRALGPKGITPKRITLIEILPDLPAEESPKPTDKEQSAGPKQNTSSWEEREPSRALEPLGLDSNRSAFGSQGAGATVFSLFEKADPDRLRRQARRALLRPGSDFTSVHGQELVGIEDEPAKGLQRSLKLHELLLLGRVGRAAQGELEQSDHLVLPPAAGFSFHPGRQVGGLLVQQPAVHHQEGLQRRGGDAAALTELVEDRSIERGHQGQVD